MWIVGFPCHWTQSLSTIEGMPEATISDDALQGGWSFLAFYSFQIFMDKLVVYSGFLPYLDLFYFTYQQLIYLNVYKLGMIILLLSCKLL